MISEEAFTLAENVRTPKLAPGTWFIDNDKAADAVRSVIAIGYSGKPGTEEV